jgi:hypothetical protein
VAKRDADVVGIVPHRDVVELGEVAREVAAQVHGMRLPPALGQEGGELGPQPRPGQRAVDEQQRWLA